MKLASALLASLAILAVPFGASAQGYPTKSISLVVPFAAGGPTDIVARTLAANMSRTLGQTVVVENKPGAGGTLAGGFVSKAAPDGYTFLIHHNGMSTAPALYRKMAFNPMTDFEYVSQAVDVPMTLIGRKDLPARKRHGSEIDTPGLLQQHAAQMRDRAQTGIGQIDFFGIGFDVGR